MEIQENAVLQYAHEVAVSIYLKMVSHTKQILYGRNLMDGGAEIGKGKRVRKDKGSQSGEGSQGKTYRVIQPELMGAHRV